MGDTSASGEGRVWHWQGSATLDSVRQATIAARRWLAAAGLPEDDLGAWELVLAEAGNNVAVHTTEEDEVRPLEMEISLLPGRVVARIIDRTAGFDWPDQVSLPDEDSESGRGLFLIEALTSARDYLRGSRGNTLVLERPWDGSPGLPSAAEQSADQAAETEATLEAMTEELSACYESLSAIFRFTAESRQCGSLPEFAERLLQHLVTVTGADCGSLKVASGETLPALATHQQERAADTANAIEAEAIATRQDQWIEPNGDDHPADGGPLAGLVHPFYHGDELMGVLSLGRRASTQPFNAGEVNVVHTFAEFFTQQVLSRRHAEEAIRTSVTRREIELAAEIQRSLLPAKLPAWPGLSIAGHCESALTVGGDFYDIMPWKSRGFLFVVADVMGKGVGASMLAAVTRLAVRSLARFYDTPSAILNEVAALLFDDFDRLEMFVTAVVGIVDGTASEVRVANAGHCPVLVAMPDGSVISCEPSTSPLGLERHPHSTETAAPFTSGSRLVAYSDGIVDPGDQRAPFQSPEEFARWFSETVRRPSTAESLRSSILERIGATASTGQALLRGDDQTILIIAAGAPVHLPD